MSPVPGVSATELLYVRLWHEWAVICTREEVSR
jgi:hypothetical protein